MRYSTFREFCARELTGGRLLFWIVWYTAHLGLFAYGWYSQATNERLALLNTLRFSVWTSRGAGLVLALDGALILLPVLRNILCFLRPRLRWLPLDDNIFFHKQVAYSIAFWSMIHTTAHYVNFYNVEATKARPVKAWQIHYTQIGGVTGHIMLLCMVLMYVTAQIKVRRQCFEAFWYTHHLAFIFMAALYSHASGCFVRDTAMQFSPFTQSKKFWQHCIGYHSFRYEVVVGVLYIFERIYREFRARRATTLTKVIQHPKGVMELRLKKPSFKFVAGQYLFLNVPEISKFQYHPFTITSAPQDDYISLHIRRVGDWTKLLSERLGITSNQTGFKALTLPKIRIDGPYGCPAQDIQNHEIAILVGAGIGITPWSSILSHIYHLRRLQRSTVSLIRVEVIWICRDPSEFEWFHTLLQELESTTTSSAQLHNPDRTDFLKLGVYLTKLHTPDEIKNLVLNDGGRDSITGLTTRTHFGRPNFSTILSNVKIGLRDGNYIAGYKRRAVTKVGVYYCGPDTAGRSLKNACREVGSKDIKFEFHKERF